MLFSELPLKPELLKAIEELGFTQPTQVQEKSIPLLIEEDRDLIGLAQTGTGKTAAFGLPMIHRIDVKKNIVQGLVIAPTRELCVQISNDFKAFSKFIKCLSVATIYGGASMDKQSREIRSGAQIVVATPGRLMDMMKRRMIKINNVSYVVLDEADEMLSMGFKKELDEILEFLSEAESKWLFSATMPDGIKQIVNEHMNANAHRITVSGSNVVNTKIDHKFVLCEDADKFLSLIHI